ncbi:MAG: hypothetical protein M1820_009152 [Bogoriella megaspora]|nr:MAG: hypothetical protein M1820_009152 [Bogoriella megaspora]
MSVSSSNQADVLYNRANVSLARCQRIVRSWSIAHTETELARPPSTVEHTAEHTAKHKQSDEEVFQPVPETWATVCRNVSITGVDVSLLIDEATSIKDSISRDDRLRKQLLGKNASKFSDDNSKHSKHSVVKPLPNGPSSSSNRAPQNDDSDDEGGRASSFKSKKQRFSSVGSTAFSKIASDGSKALIGYHSNNPSGDGNDDSDNSLQDEAHSRNDLQPTQNDCILRKRNFSYLDEVLNQKAKKTKKRRKKGNKELNPAMS